MRQEINDYENDDADFDPRDSVKTDDFGERESAILCLVELREENIRVTKTYDLDIIGEAMPSRWRHLKAIRYNMTLNDKILRINAFYLILNS